MRYAAIYSLSVPEHLFTRLGGKKRYLPTYTALEPESEEGAAMLALLTLSLGRHAGPPIGTRDLRR